MFCFDLLICFCCCFGFCFVLFSRQGFSGIPGCSRTFSVDQAGLELTKICLPPSPDQRTCDQRCLPLLPSLYRFLNSHLINQDAQVKILLRKKLLDLIAQEREREREYMVCCCRSMMYATEYMWKQETAVCSQVSSTFRWFRDQIQVTSLQRKHTGPSYKYQIWHLDRSFMPYSEKQHDHGKVTRPLLQMENVMYK